MSASSAPNNNAPSIPKDNVVVRDYALDLKSKVSINPNYLLHKILPNAGSGSITINGSAESVFDLPSEVYNLAQSTLGFTFTPGGGTHYNYIPADCIAPVKKFFIKTRSGTSLCEVDFVGNYTSCVFKSDISFKDYMEFPLGAGASDSVLYGIRPGNSTAWDRWDNTANNRAYIEPLYFIVGGDTTATPVIVYKIPLKLIKHCLLSVDKSLYFGEVLEMHVVWNAPAKLGFNATGAADPSVGAAAMTANATITNCTLFLAEEHNPDLAQAVKDKWKGGHKMPIPYIYSFSTPVAASTGQTVRLRFTASNGRRLARIYHSIFNTVESANTVYTHDMRAAATDKMTSFYTNVNSSIRQQFQPLTLANYEDYMSLQPVIKGSVLLDTDVFLYNWMYIEVFDENRPLWEREVYDDTDLKGLPLDDPAKAENTWDFVCTTTNSAFVHYDWAVCIKILEVGPNGINCQ